MNKKASANKIIIFSIIILIIILIIIVSYFLIINKGGGISLVNREAYSASGCDALEEGIAKWRCYDDLAKEERSLEICDKISKSNYKDACYYGVARVKNDISICYQIIGDYASDIQREICLREMVELKTQKCELERWGAEYQANCLRTVAILNDNLTACEEIEVKSYKDSCIKHITLNLQEK